MIEPNSRYSATPIAHYTTPAGETVAYLRRRFHPQGRTLDLLAEATVAEGDRLDLISARILGDSEAFWQICDANDALKPHDLVSEPGRVLRVPVPGFR